MSACGQERVGSGYDGGGNGRSVEYLGRAELAAGVGDEEEGLQHREQSLAGPDRSGTQRFAAAIGEEYC